MPHIYEVSGLPGLTVCTIDFNLCSCYESKLDLAMLTTAKHQNTDHHCYKFAKCIL